MATAADLEGILQFTDDRRDGQLRDPAQPLRPIPGNIVVPRQMIRDLNLRPGLQLKGQSKGNTLKSVDTIEGIHPDDYAHQTSIYDATALDPQPWMRLEHDPAEYTTRILDIPEAESTEILEQLFAASRDPAIQYRHEWRDGDMVMWDNRALIHLATGCPPEMARTLHRTTIRGVRPAGMAA